MNRITEKPRILVISNFYLPGNKSGGGTRTIVNTVQRLSERYEFFIVTRGYDAGERGKPYTSVEIGEWNDVGACKVLYLREDKGITKVLPQVIDEVRPSALYANSFFSDLTIRALWMRRLRKIPALPFVIAPCGELSKGALAQKSLKKRIFLRVSAAVGLYDGLYWKASSESEAREFEEFKVSRKGLAVAPDLPPRSIFSEFSLEERHVKEAGSARFVFLSRFDRKKNLTWLLESVKVGEGSAELDVYGNIHDQKYFDRFMELGERGGHGFRVEYKGTVDHDKVPSVLSEYDFFVLPTLGENFGHVFLEALAAGCPVITTDRVPWEGIADEGAGWRIPLEDPRAWNEVIGKCMALGNEEHRRMVASARGYAERYLADPELERPTVELLESAIDGG